MGRDGLWLDRSPTGRALHHHEADAGWRAMLGRVVRSMEYRSATLR
jgi:hypothetical protein